MMTHSQRLVSVLALLLFSLLTASVSADDPAPYRIRIEFTNGPDHMGAPFGEPVTLGIFVDSADGTGFSGFDFMITYDAVALNLLEVDPGQVQELCEWEYFAYRYETAPDPHKAKIRIIGLAETSDGPFHPICDFPYAEGPVSIATLHFLVTSDNMYHCQYTPVEFYWSECDDNTIRNSQYPGMRYVENNVYQYDQGASITDHDFGVPGWYGIPDSCVDVLTNESIGITANRAIDFFNGGVDIDCDEDPEVAGDVNLNGIQYEVADAVMFSHYFLQGVGAFNTHVDGSIMASDIDENGIPLELADYYYLCRIITGEAITPPGFVNWAVNLNVAESTGGLVFSAPDDVQGIWLEIKGEFQPQGVNPNNVFLREFDGSVTRLLFVGDDFGFDHFYAPLEGRQLFGSADHAPEILKAQASTYYGQAVEVELGIVLDADDGVELQPNDFTLRQNYPNPFNPETQIAFDLPEPTNVTLEIYNVMGQKVRTLFEGQQPAGEHLILWDGNDDTGSKVASGIYLYRLTAGKEVATKKMLMLK